MLRSPSVASRYNDDLSSPDPLATSINDEHIANSATHRRRKSPARRVSSTTSKIITRHAKSSSQSIDVFPSSPFRTVSEQNLSPWKIRVTVEAEPDDTIMSASAATSRARTRATKTSIQDGSSPSDHAEIAARGRKSQTVVGCNKRSGTPARGSRNSSRSRRQSVTNLDIIPLGDDDEEDDWLKQQKSPRKKASPRKSTTATSRAQKPSSPSRPDPKSSSTDFEVRPDTDAEGEDTSGEPGPALCSESPELKKLDLNQISVRPRALSTQDKDDMDDARQDSISNTKTRAATRQTDFKARTVSANSALSYPTPSPTSSYHGDSDNVEKPVDGEPGAAEGHEGFDTMMESEGFTMIDLDTLPSAKQDRSPPEEDSRSNADAAGMRPVARVSATDVAQHSSNEIRASSASMQPIVAYPLLTVDESEISSTVPSSPPMSTKSESLLKVASSRPHLLRKVTPMLYSSPKLPSLPRHQIRRTPLHKHRASAGALFAGIALQEVVSPEGEQMLPKEKGLAMKSSSPNGEAALFGGFDSGTQRELRAGLRFGEELAKRQMEDKPGQLATGFDASYPKTKQQGVHDAQERASNEDSVESMPHTPQTKTSHLPEQPILDTMARREREWQLEREAVSRQIQNASESQVIVIDSDSENEEIPDQAYDQVGDETDIWLAEAQNSSSPNVSSQAHGTNLFTRTEQNIQRERANEAISRPRRSLIPSPWKRGEDFDTRHEQSTFLSTNMDELSGLNLYNEPQSKIRFGAGQIKKQQLRQRSNSGRFDIDLMAGTPKKEDAENESFGKSDEDAADENEEDRYELHNTGMSDNEASPLVSDTDVRVSDEDSTIEISRSSGSSSSPVQPVRIPVNFNDSSLSMPTLTPQPPRFQPGRPVTQPQTTITDSPPHPPTPRSAMKGARDTFRRGMSPVKPDSPTMTRRVIFSGRSRGVDIDGQESSFSMRSVSDDSFGGEVGRQLQQELQAVTPPPVAVSQFQPQVNRPVESSQPPVKEESATPEKEIPAEVATKGWSSWIWGSKQPQPEPESSTIEPDMDQPALDERTRSTPKLKQAMQPAPRSTQQESQDQDQQAWQPTIKSSIPSATTLTQRGPLTSTIQLSQLPSYLLPPSYPSDPTRSPLTSPLSLSGTFTTTHFRTLHIIYRKSLRPKFHPPARAHIRPAIWALRGKEFIVDESASGIAKGEFVWLVGDGECEVLERFMQECELDSGWYRGLRVVTGEAEGGGRGEGKEVQWGWSAEELAERLCRIVVGEVVREEEAKARAKAKAIESGRI